VIVRRTGLSSGIGPSFSFIMFRSSIDIRPQHYVAVDKDAHWISGPDVKVGWSARSFDTMRCPASFAVLFTLSRSPTMMRLLL